MLSHQKVAILERDQKVWPYWSRYGTVGRSVSLGVDFGVSEAQGS